MAPLTTLLTKSKSKGGGGHQNGSTGTKVITQKHYKNTIFQSFGPLASKRVWKKPPFSIPDFILYIVRIIVLKFHGNQSTGTKVIARKPMCLQTDNNDDRPQTIADLPTQIFFSM